MPADTQRSRQQQCPSLTRGHEPVSGPHPESQSWDHGIPKAKPTSFGPSHRHGRSQESGKWTGQGSQSGSEVGGVHRGELQGRRAGAGVRGHSNPPRASALDRSLAPGFQAEN